MYRVAFLNQGKVYEVYVKKVSQSGLMGFIELEGFLFEERSSIVIDPVEKRLQTEFDGVERSYIPMHAVIRVDEVAKRGTAKITSGSGDSSKVMPFPFYGGSKSPKGD